MDPDIIFAYAREFISSFRLIIELAVGILLSSWVIRLYRWYSFRYPHYNDREHWYIHSTYNPGAPYFDDADYEYDEDESPFSLS
jgi:hypothetical protein